MAAPDAPPTAVVTRLPPELAGRALAPWRAWALFPFAVLGPLSLPLLQLVIGTVILEHVRAARDWGVPLVVAAPFLGLVIVVLYLLWYGDYLPSRAYLRASRREVANRADAVVHPDDPDATYIQVIPRRNWRRPMLENAADVGFLRLDRDRGLLLFEGDVERWVIPAGCVRDVGVEEFAVTRVDRWLGNVVPQVVLEAEVDGRRWVRLFCPRHVRFVRYGPAARRAAARELLTAIRELARSEEG